MMYLFIGAKSNRAPAVRKTQRVIYPPVTTVQNSLTVQNQTQTTVVVVVQMILIPVPAAPQPETCFTFLSHLCK